jgi:hypothetical protein
MKTLGIQGKLLVGAVGSTPTVVLADEQEVNLNCENSMAKYATRGQPRNNSRITTQDLSIDFTVVKDFTNASFVLLQAAAMARAPIAVKSLDNVSGFGWDGDWNFSMKEGQPLDGFTTVQFTGSHTNDYRELTEIVPDDE